MRELRVQSKGCPIRIFYAFDERRVAMLLIGGDKTGDDRFYPRMIREADRLFDAHVAGLANEKKTPAPARPSGAGKSNPTRSRAGRRKEKKQ